MNHPAYQRGLLLYEQGRFDMAEKALREALGAVPHDATAHAMLGLCLLHQEKFDEATAEAQAGIVNGPDSAFAHYALGGIMHGRNRFNEAEVSAKEAVRLAPGNTDYWALLAATYFSQARWTEALAAADQGLAFNPEHTQAINVRAMALVKLGRNEEARQTIQGALGRNPQSGSSHANQGWTLLHQGKPKEALEHFREALRLQPNNEWARDGMIAALKARYFLYRMMLRYYLWMSKFNRRGRWAIVIGLWVVVQVLQGVRASQPGLEPFILPVILAYCGFVLASWLLDPVFNLTLLLSRYGRHLLKVQQKVTAVIVGVLVVVTLPLVGLGLYWQNDLLLICGILMGGAALSAAATGGCRRPLHLLLMSIYTVVAVGVGAAGIVMMCVGMKEGGDVFIGGIVALVLSALAANVLGSLIQKK